MVEVTKRIYEGNNQLKYFMINQWTIHDTNVQNLLMKMIETDRKIFPIDANEMKWDLYIKNYCMVRNYLLKQNANSLENFRKQSKRLVALFVAFYFDKIFNFIYMQISDYFIIIIYS